MITFLLSFSIMYTPITEVRDWYDTMASCERAGHTEQRIARQELGMVPAFQCRRVVR